MTTQAPFGRLSTAMVTPFKKDLSIDWDGVATLAQHLLSTGHDAIIVNGTTGEAPTTSDDEKDQIVKVVKDAVAGKAKVVAGAGNNETTHSVEQALRAQKAGADGLLVVTPYYNKPPQAGIEAHFRAIADATDLPVMMYDIPGRTGMQIEPDTIVKLSEHPRIVALKDAKGDLLGQWVLFQCVVTLLEKIYVKCLIRGLLEILLVHLKFIKNYYQSSLEHSARKVRF
jgi:4-hydroxy-tetrahydrodipicolinate synthase